MFTKFFTYLSTVTFANGLQIGNPEELNGMMNFAEVQAEFPPVPSLKWEDDVEICYTWASYEGYDLHNLCDEGTMSGNGLRQTNTIDDIKGIVEEEGYDGFTIQHVIHPGWSEWWANVVWFKMCPREGPQHNPNLASALVQRWDKKFFWRMPHPCTHAEEEQMSEEEALELIQEECIGDDSSCLAESLNDPALVELTNELLDLALDMV